MPVVGAVAEVVVVEKKTAVVEVQRVAAAVEGEIQSAAAEAQRASFRAILVWMEVKQMVAKTFLLGIGFVVENLCCVSRMDSLEIAQEGSRLL